MRTALFAAAALAAFGLAAGPAAAHDDDHHRHKRHHDRHYGDDDDRGRHYRDGGHYRHGDRDGYGYREAYRHDEWRGRGFYRDGPAYGYGQGYGYGYRHAPPPPPRVVIRVPVGGYFDDGYDRLVGEYYGRDCRRYSAYRGEWRRPYRIGYDLPHDVAWSYVPSDLHRRLPPPPYGHNYISVDRDVLLVAEASKRVIDAVVILSGR